MMPIEWTAEELSALEDEARESGRSPVDIVKEAEEQETPIVCR